VDPFLGSDLERYAVPFTATAAPGRHPVSLSSSRREGFRKPTTPGPVGPVAAVKLTVRDDPVVVWELALQPGQDPATLRPGEIPGFVVDSGTGSFLDASAVPALRRLGDPGPELEQDSELDKLVPGDLAQGCGQADGGPCLGAECGRLQLRIGGWGVSHLGGADVHG
jgi:hypothetical protein